MTDKERKEFDKKIDKVITYGCLIGIIVLMIMAVAPSLFYPLLILTPFVVVVGILIGIRTINQDNNGKDGYYAEYGTSYGMNADKHEKYIKEKIANNIMNEVIK